jgi:hypothetical protein
MDVARRSAGDLFFLSVCLHAQLGHAEISVTQGLECGLLPWHSLDLHLGEGMKTRWELARLVTEKRRPEAGHGVEVTGLIHDHLCGPRWDVRLENRKPPLLPREARHLQRQVQMGRSRDARFILQDERVPCDLGRAHPFGVPCERREVVFHLIVRIGVSVRGEHVFEGTEQDRLLPASGCRYAPIKSSVTSPT